MKRVGTPFIKRAISLSLLIAAFVGAIFLWDYLAQRADARSVHRPGESFPLKRQLNFQFRMANGRAIALNALQASNILSSYEFVLPPGIRLTNVVIGIHSGPHGSSLIVEALVQISSDSAPGEKEVALRMMGLTNTAKALHSELLFLADPRLLNNDGSWRVKSFSVADSRSPNAHSRQ
jgi:hypothetical protein